MNTRIISEEVEPFAAMIVGRMWARVEEAKTKGPERTFDACVNFWWAVKSLNRLAIAIRAPHDTVDAVHFSIATSNEVSRAAQMIRATCGVDPFEDPSFQAGW